MATPSINVGGDRTLWTATELNLLRDGVAELQGIASGGSLSPVYNVVQLYSADNTGVSDASTAIQSAITAAGTAGGGIVYLPKGTYLINTALNMAADNVVLMGAGFGSILKSTTNDRILKGTSCAKIIIRDLQLLGDADVAKTNQRGIEWISVTNGLIHNVYVKNVGYDGILLLSGCVGCRIEACSTEGCGDDGINIGGDTSTSTTDTTVVGCTVKNSTDDGIHISDGSLRTTATGNTVIGCTNGFSLYNAKQVTIVGNTVSGPSSHGIAVVHTGCQDVTIANNIILNAGAQGIRIATDAVRFAIKGNIIRTPASYGIICSMDAAQAIDTIIEGNVITGVTTNDGVNLFQCSRVLIKGNRIDTVGRNGIRLDNLATLVRIEGNMISGATDYSIRLAGSAASSNDDCAIEGNRTIGSPRGIYCAEAPGVAIRNNDVKDAVNYGIVLSAASLRDTGGIIAGNTINGACNTGPILVSNYKGVIIDGNRVIGCTATNSIAGGGSSDLLLVVNNYCFKAIASLGASSTSANNIASTGV